MAVQIQARRGDSTLWTSSNPVLAEGELGVELDTHRWKVGDGTTAWNSLGYATDLELLPIIGSRTYTEQNYVTDSESVTASIDALDVGVAAHLADNTSAHGINTLANKQQESWKNITLLNGWQNSILPQFRKNNFGELELQGRIGTGVTAIGTVLFTLPEGYYSYRPFYVPTSTAPITGDPYIILLEITTTGEVKINQRVAGYYINLDGISIPL